MLKSPNRRYNKEIEKKTKVGQASKIYKEIALKPIHVDMLIEKLDMPSTTILSALSMLELKGYIKKLSNQQYSLGI